MSFERDGYGEDGLEHDQWRLRSAPQFDTYNGMIFACLNSETESLDEYLGDFKWYLDFYTGRSEAGMEVLGTPQRWVVDANWKLGADNFIGDAYHTSTTHQSTVEVDIQTAETADFLKGGIQVHTEKGGLVFLDGPRFENYPEPLKDSFRRALGEDQWNAVSKAGHGQFPADASLFPNFSLLNAGSMPESGQPAPYTTLRLWHPIDSNRMEVWSWFFVEKDAPKPFKQLSKKSHEFSFGSSGTLEQDDTENWRRITDVSGGSMADEQFLNYQMGRNNISTLDVWPGPGTAYPESYHEANQRAYFRMWAEYMK